MGGASALNWEFNWAGMTTVSFTHVAGSLYRPSSGGSGGLSTQALGAPLYGHPSQYSTGGQAGAPQVRKSHMAPLLSHLIHPTIRPAQVQGCGKRLPPLMGGVVGTGQPSSIHHRWLWAGDGEDTHMAVPGRCCRYQLVHPAAWVEGSVTLWVSWMDMN